MKKVFYSLAFCLLSLNVFAQNDSCTGDSITIYLNTNDTVYTQVNAPYSPDSVTIFYKGMPAPPATTSITSTSDVNLYVIGTYTNCYTATMSTGASLSCCRTVIVKDIASNNKLQEIGLTVYPQPVNSNSFFVTGLPNHNYSLELRDIQGRLVPITIQKSDNLNKIEIDGSVAKGMYTLVATNNETRLTSRLVIQ